MLTTTVRQYLTACMENQTSGGSPRGGCVSIHSAMSVVLLHMNARTHTHTHTQTHMLYTTTFAMIGSVMSL